MIFKIGINPKEHDDFVVNHQLSNLLQSSSWGNIKTNWLNEIVGVYDNDKLVASSLILIKKLPLNFTLFYIPKGPILNYENKELLEFYFSNLKKYAKKQKCLFVKIDPGILVNKYFVENKNDEKYLNIDIIIENLKSVGLVFQGYTTYIKESIQPRFQAVVYKDLNFEENLPRKTKKFIRKAIKYNLKVSKVSCDRLDDFCNIIELTEKRKNINLRSKKYFLNILNTYKKDADLFLAEIDIEEVLLNLNKELEENNKAILKLEGSCSKKLPHLLEIKRNIEEDINDFKGFTGKLVVAGTLLIKFGKWAELLYGGLDIRFKKLNAQYYLKAEIIKYLFDNNIEFANMGGVEGDLKDGLTKFKAHFNPYINEYIGEFDLPTSKFYKLAAYLLKQRQKNM